MVNSETCPNWIFFNMFVFKIEIFFEYTGYIYTYFKIY